MKPSALRRLTVVQQVRANQALEGLHPDAKDLELQAGYVAGTVSIDDMLAHAREFTNQFKTKAAIGRPVRD